MQAAALLGFLRFETPGYLVLLATLPILAALSVRSLSGLGPIRRSLAILARCAVVTLMVLALSGAERTKTTDDATVIFVVDRSSSIPLAQQRAAFDFVKSAADAVPASRRTKDRFGVIAFDGRSAVEQLPMGALGIDRLGEALRPEQTNLAGALAMAMALFTDDASRRVVVLSDGNENVGHAMEEAERFAAAGVPIDVVPLRFRIDDEVVFERLAAPATANAEETVNLQMVLRSSKQVRGKIVLRHNDVIEDLDPDGPGFGYAVTLQPGANRFTVPLPMRVAGAHRFQATFEPDVAGADTIPGNNQGRAFTIVSGQGRILILAQPSSSDSPGHEESAVILAQALAREKLVCDVKIVGDAPIDAVSLLEYSLVILSNVSADQMKENERLALASYVRDLGGGLIMVGGDSSFGPGGWMDTPIEEVMPVSFDVKSKQQIPKGALVLCMHACEIPAGNYWGERVAIAAVKTLSSRDLVGVLSYQWRGVDQKYWDVPLQEVRDKSGVIQKIQKMQMGDMPDLDPPMRAGVDSLVERKDAKSKHMIVISDFDPSAPRQDLLDKMKQHGITCSTVAIGFGGHAIDVGTAKRIAEYTGGRYYDTQDYSQLPQIFIKETRIVHRSLINETPFTPQIGDRLSTLIEGLAGEPIPQLGGYVVTTPKPLATVALFRRSQDGNDPVLAHWQVGLGKTVAFTSGMWPRWGTEWSEWPKFSKVWAQIARWASRQSAAAAFDVSTSVQGGRGKIRIEALDKNAAAINFMTVEGTMLRPDLSASALQLTQVGPGRYEAEFDARDTGSYVLNLAYQMGRGADAVRGTLQSGLSVAFSPEYRELAANEAMLKELSERTGGRRLEFADADKVFDRSQLTPAQQRRSIWEQLTQLMLLLFLLDVAIRRIAINPAEIARKIRKRIAEMGAFGKSSEATAAVLTTLKGTRERVRDEASAPAAKPDAGAAPTRSARYEPPVPDARVTQKLSDALGGASETDAPVVAKPTRKPAPTNEADYASRLLKAKQKAREKLEDDEVGGGSA